MKCGLSATVLKLWYDSQKEFSLIDFCNSYYGYSSEFHGQLVDLCVMYDIRIEDLNKYFNAHMIPRDRFNSCLYDSTFQMWRDYIEACENIGVDLRDRKLLFPKDLPKAHDERIVQVRVKENAQLVARSLRSLERRDKQYRFENDRFIIYIPHTVQELIDESNMQCNCVAKNYTEGHFRDELTICFLREKSHINESFYTIEIHGKTVWQKRGYLNDVKGRADSTLKKERWEYYMSRPKREADAFYNLWLSWVRKGSPRDAKGNPIIEKVKERKRA
ncbi:MAG: PcfJ domain-containing protein [Clostridia bacterium]|nr:PcfJ domain-containing protein [Clostridia bacterium]